MNASQNGAKSFQVKDQQEAEKQKAHSQEIQKLLEIQKVEIATKKTEVMADLDKVEPAVIDAQQAVKSIRKQHLVSFITLSVNFVTSFFDSADFCVLSYGSGSVVNVPALGNTRSGFESQLGPAMIVLTSMYASQYVHRCLKNAIC
jgi:hypothetical protein